MFLHTFSSSDGSMFYGVFCETNRKKDALKILRNGEVKREFPENDKPSQATRKTIIESLTRHMKYKVSHGNSLSLT